MNNWINEHEKRNTYKIGLMSSLGLDIFSGSEDPNRNYPKIGVRIGSDSDIGKYPVE